MFRRIRISRSRGMSIIEIFIAYTILLVAVLALLGSMPMAARQRTDSIVANQALYYAEQKMDELVRNDVRISTGTMFTDNPLNDDTMVRTWFGDIGDVPGLETVTVKVTWMTQHGQNEVVLRSCLQI